MSLINKIKTLFNKKEIAQEVKPEEISLEELEKWTLSEKSKINSELAKSMVSFTGEAKEALAKLIVSKTALGKIDLSARKENEKVKLIVAESASNLSSLLERLISEIESSLEKGLPLDRTIKEIENRIEQFITASAKSSSKASLLIGKELEDAAGSLKSVSSLCKKYAEENRTAIIRRDVLEKLESLNEIYQNKLINTSSIKNRVEGLKSHINSTESKIKEIEEKISKIKESGNYLAYSEKLKEKDEIEILLERNARRVKDSIPEKLLEAKHKNASGEEKEIIESYKLDAVASLSKDIDLIIANILNEASKSFQSEAGARKKKDKYLSNPPGKEHFAQIKEERKNLEERHSTVTSEIESLEFDLSLKKEEKKIEQLKNMINDGHKEEQEYLLRLAKESNKLAEVESEIRSHLSKY